MRRKRLNVTRRAGRFYFRRETRRLHDGTPDGETLWVFSSTRKPRRVVFVNIWELPVYRAEGKTVSIHIGHYRIVSPIVAARMIREYLTQDDVS